MQLHDTLGLDPFFAEFDRLTQRLFEGAARGGHTRAAAALPTDVVRRGDDLLVVMDLPGSDWTGMDVHVEGRVLTVSATREPEQHEGDVVFLRGRAYGQVRQQFTLPEGLDTEHIEASYDCGVLTLRIPVAPAARARRIEIRNGPAQKEIQAS